MIIRANISRRIFLRTLAFIGALNLNRPIYALTKLPKHSAPNPLISNLANFFTHKESAKKVGLAYLREKPEEANVDLMVDLISTCQAHSIANIAEIDLYEIRKFLRHKQRLDFEHGRIVKVQGWILSETEVRLCALATLV